MNEYKLHQVFSTKIGDSSPVKPTKNERLRGGGRGALGCKQPRYPVLQPVGVGGYEGGATRLPTVMTEAELLAKMTGAGGLGKGDFRTRKVVTVEVAVQGISGVKMMKFHEISGRKWTAIRICNVRYALWNIGPSHGKSTMCETFAPQK